MKLVEEAMKRNLARWEKEFLEAYNDIELRKELLAYLDEIAKENLGYDHKRESAVDNLLAKLVPELADAAKVGRNANEFVSYNLIIKEIADRRMWETVVPYVHALSRGAWEALKFHKDGCVFIHKVPDSAVVGYCIGHDIRKVLRNGLVHLGHVRSAPPKHLLSALMMTAEFLIGMQSYFTGAQAFGAPELWFAPFVEKDGLDLQQVQNIVQSFYFNLNHPWRPGGGTPFTNITIYNLADRQIMTSKAIVGGKELPDELQSFERGIDIMFKAIFKTEMEGDAVGSPFTYPIPNVMMTKKLMKWIEEDPERFEYFYLASGLQGAQYYENGIEGTTNILGEPAYIDPETIQAMCGRGLWSKAGSESRVLARAIFGIADETGSKGVATLNLPRIAMEAKGDLERGLEMIEEMMRGTVLEWLKFIHKWYLWLRFKALPEHFKFVNFYQPYHIYRDIFNLTFGAMGMTDAAHIYADEDWTVWKSNDYNALFKLVRDFVRPQIEKMREVSLTITKEIKEELGIGDGGTDFLVPELLVNVEEVPAETAGS